MEFDLFTFIAQIVNFLLLLYLLYKFLFSRIKNAMDERERRVSESFASMEKLRAQAADLERQNLEFAQQIGAHCCRRLN